MTTQFGEALTQLLHERGLTQSELGRRLAVTSSAVNLWARGGKPSRDNVERIERELQAERGSLLGLLGYAPDGDGDSPTVESLIRADPGLDTEDKRVLLRILLLARERHMVRAARPATTAAEYQEHEAMAEAHRAERERAGSRG